MLKLDDLSSLSHETTLENFHATIDRKPEVQKTVTCGNQSYYVETYTVQTGTSMSYVSNGKTSYAVSVPVGDQYHFVFKDNQLEWWGFQVDMAKSSDSMIVALADSLVSIDARQKASRRTY
jgi:hypothetical protein